MNFSGSATYGGIIGSSTSQEALETLAVWSIPKLGCNGSVCLSDINEDMLRVGRQRLEDAGIAGNVSYALANAESLPFKENYFDRVTIAFGLRNVTDKNQALREMRRVLKPGGRAFILEFSQVRNEQLRRIYDGYSFSVLPLLGKAVAGDSDSYRYLAESIRRPPKSGRPLTADAGMRLCLRSAFAISAGGVVAIHSGSNS